MTPTGVSAARAVWRRRVLAVTAFALATAAAAHAAVAQDFIKVDDAAREQLPATPFIGVAYGFIWIALLGYLFIVARGLGKVRDELRSLRERLDRASVSGRDR
jgi:CcmD family protein